MEAGMKRCNTCGMVKPLSEFHRKRGARDGRQPRCRPCNIEANKQWYRDHPEARARRMDDYAKKRRRSNQQRVLDYLRSHPCVDCGEHDPVVLDFDHLGDKRANISSMLGCAWSSILDEIAKCEVRCANCHRRISAQRGNWFRLIAESDL